MTLFARLKDMPRHIVPLILLVLFGLSIFFVVGAVSLFHGRYFLTIQLWSVDVIMLYLLNDAVKNFIKDQ